MTSSDINTAKNDNRLSDGWKYWKARQGSAGNSSRKLSSIDPLDCQPTPQPTEPLPPSIQEDQILEGQIAIRSNDGLVPKEPDVQAQTLTWGNFWNPLTYALADTFNSSPPSPAIGQDQESIRSQSTCLPTQNGNSWFGWLWPGAKAQQNLDNESESGNPQDLVTSMELKKSSKEYRKAVANNDVCWAWYQNHYNNNQFNGEVSVLGTKSEALPVELSKYPIDLDSSKDTDLESKDGDIVPVLANNYRTITNVTKIRLGAQLYYNFNAAEKHLYIKQNLSKPEIRYVLVISIICNNNAKQPRIYSAKKVSDNCVEAIDHMFRDRVDEKGENIEYQVESISLELGKIKDSSIEDLFKLLINWRVNFKKIDFLFMAGYKQTFPLSCQLLQILLSRGLMDSVKKTGLISIDGLVPNLESILVKTTNGTSAVSNATLTETSEIEKFPWFKNFDLIISDLISKYNVKLTFLGSHFNISTSLGIRLSHPNIFRCLFIRNPNIPFSTSNNSAPQPNNSNLVTKFNNDFEIQLLKLLLTGQNLGHSSSRLLIQITKYFQPITGSSQPVPSIMEHLTPEFFANALQNSLNTTTLLRKQTLKIHRIEDDIINNEYNLIWTLHAFLNDYKTLKNVHSMLEIKKLIELYHLWNPRGKGLKDLKYMLEVLKIEDYSGTIFRRCDGAKVD